MKKKSLAIIIIVLAMILSISLVACKDKEVVVSGVSLNTSSLTLVIGTQGTLTAAVQPEDAVNKNVTWSSSNEAVATVNGGVVSALTLGTSVITVTTEEGGFTATCTVTVTINPLDRVVTKTAPAVVYPDYDGADTLVVGYSPFSSKFSPFFSKTGYDQDVAAMTQLSLLTTDRQGNVILKGIDGETYNYNGKPYTYNGIANANVTINADKTVTYSFEMRDDIFFSDGVHMTIDDVIFSMYVLSDPTYDGGSTFYAQPILGMNAYRTNVEDNFYADLEAKFAAITEAGLGHVWSAEDSWSQAEQAAYEEYLHDNGIIFTTEIYNYVMANYLSSDYEALMGPFTAEEISANEGLKTAFAMRMWGFGSYTKSDASTFDGKFKDALDNVYDLETEFPTIEDYWTNILESYGYNYSSTDGLNYESAGSDIEALTKTQFISELGADLMNGQKINNIRGIVKTGDYSLTVTMSKYDATAIYQLGVSVAPLHYYGNRAAYKYTENKFGFTKGDLSTVRAKTTAPMGAGAYKFVKFENGIVYFERNGHYYKGAPNITNIQFRETDDADKVSGVISGTFDITDPSINNEIVKQIKKANGDEINGSINGSVIDTSLVDNLGYGYIGLNAARIKVGENSASEASKNYRKALATIFAVHRDVVINSYYGDRGVVINYPISNTSWAAPQPTDEGYAIAYSIKVNGDPIYTVDMDAPARYAAAIAAAIDFLKAAGFTFDSNTGMFTDVPAITAHIPAEGKGEHPSFVILTNAKADLATIGVNLIINDYSDQDAFWDGLEADAFDIWCAAWGATPDPDMYQVYHSSNIIGLPGSTGSNHYNITDANLDEMMMAARESADRAYRKAIYKQCLETIMDWGVEIPIYQRKNAIIFSTGRVNLDTLTPDITTFWGWMNDIEELEMN